MNRSPLAARPLPHRQYAHLVFAGLAVIGELEPLSEHGLEHLRDLLARRSLRDRGLYFEIFVASEIRRFDLRQLDSKRSRQERERRVAADLNAGPVDVEGDAGLDDRMVSGVSWGAGLI